MQLAMKFIIWHKNLYFRWDRRWAHLVNGDELATWLKYSIIGRIIYIAIRKLELSAKEVELLTTGR